jgi:hypothetical protein
MNDIIRGIPIKPIHGCTLLYLNAIEDRVRHTINFTDPVNDWYALRVWYIMSR